MANYIDKLKGMDKDQQQDEIQQKVQEHESELIDTEVIAGEIASSNATDWDLDEVEVLNISFPQPNEAHAKIAFVLSGEQDEDKPFSGTKMKGEALVVIDGDGDGDFKDVTAERDLGAD
jgi:hypothetical protein